MHTLAKFSVFLFVVALTSPVGATTPTHERLRSEVFTVFRLLTDPDRQPASGAGLWTWNSDTGATRLAAPLVYGFAENGEDASLSAFYDRIVLQGPAVFEFDALTVRLLRQYQPLHGESGSWAFQGVIITPEDAAAAGIPPGTYGFPICPNGREISNACGAELQFPGYPAPTSGVTNFKVLLVRGLDPTDDTLRLVTELPEMVPDDPMNNIRKIALDLSRRAFWFRYEGGLANGTDAFLQLSYVPFTTLQETVISRHDWLRGDDPLLLSTSWALHYDPHRDQLLRSALYPALPRKESTVRLVDPASGAETDVDYQPPYPPIAMTQLAALPPPTYEQIIPAVGRTPGANGTHWQSELWLYNPSADETDVKLRRVTSPARPTSVHLAGHASAAITDILATLGGGPVDEGGDGVGTDAIVITAPYRWGEQVAAYSRTYTGTLNGTYGECVPAVPGTTGYSNHLQHTTAGTVMNTTHAEFIIDKRDLTRYRHNIGAVNDSDEPFVLTFRYGDMYGAGTPPQLIKTITVPPHQVLNTRVETLFSEESIKTYAGFVWVIGDRPAPVWISVIDNVSGDSTFVPFTTFNIQPDRETTMALPGVARTPGVGGTSWQTDIYANFVNTGNDDFQQLPLATFYPAGGSVCTSGPATATLGGPVGEPGNPTFSRESARYRRIFPDVVSQFSACTAAAYRGTIETRMGAWTGGFARTYTTRADGGTFGDMLPFYPVRGFPAQHFSGIVISTTYRTNLGLYNGFSYPVQNSLRVYRSDGSLAASTTVIVQPHDTVQGKMQDFVALPEGTYGLTVEPLDSPEGEGRSWAYISIIDNRTGDPTNLW